MVKDEEIVRGTLSLQKKHLETLRGYMKMVHEKDDLHGIMDASADIRETIARIETLSWVLGE